MCARVARAVAPPVLVTFVPRLPSSVRRLSCFSTPPLYRIRIRHVSHRSVRDGRCDARNASSRAPCGGPRRSRPPRVRWYPRTATAPDLRSPGGPRMHSRTTGPPPERPPSRYGMCTRRPPPLGRRGMFRRSRARVPDTSGPHRRTQDTTTKSCKVPHAPSGSTMQTLSFDSDSPAADRAGPLRAWTQLLVERRLALKNSSSESLNSCCR